MLKSVGASIFGVLGLLIVLAVPALFLVGVEWLSTQLLPWFVIASGVTFVFLIAVVVPLSMIRRMRLFAAIASLVGAHIFGATLWMWGLLSTMSLVGSWAVFVGLIFMGIGVIPIAMLAMIFNGMWGVLVQLIALLVITIGAQAYSEWIEERYED